MKTCKTCKDYREGKAVHYGSPWCEHHKWFVAHNDKRRCHQPKKGAKR